MSTLQTSYLSYRKASVQVPEVVVHLPPTFRLEDPPAFRMTMDDVQVGLPRIAPPGGGNPSLSAEVRTPPLQLPAVVPYSFMTSTATPWFWSLWAIAWRSRRVVTAPCTASRQGVTPVIRTPVVAAVVVALVLELAPVVAAVVPPSPRVNTLLVAKRMAARLACR